MKAVAGIYCLRFPNGKEYWGQSINVNERVREHFYPWYKNTPVGNAIKKYGKEAVESHVFYLPEEWLDDFEREMIARRKSIAPSGYNLDSGGNENKHHCQITKEKMAKAQRGRLRKKASEETKAKMSIAQSGPRNANFGNHFSRETRNRLSISHIGNRHSEASKEKIRIASTGRFHTKETKAKISAGLSGRICSMESRAKISLSLLKWSRTDEGIASMKAAWQKRREAK